jgi:RimJ/RimL family protein N-acetyltransferase
VLSTFEDNAIAKSLYLAMDYRQVGIRKRHFKMPKGYIDEVLFEKQLV